jgi:hypothetical protein
MSFSSVKPTIIDAFALLPATPPLLCTVHAACGRLRFLEEHKRSRPLCVNMRWWSWAAGRQSRQAVARKWLTED